MDNTRNCDLEYIDSELRAETNADKRQALSDTKTKILSQLRDKQLATLRRQLINATRQGVGRDVKILTERIRQYERRTYQ